MHSRVFREGKFTFDGENIRRHVKRAKYYPSFIILCLEYKHKEKTKDAFHRAREPLTAKDRGQKPCSPISSTVFSPLSGLPIYIPEPPLRFPEDKGKKTL